MALAAQVTNTTGAGNWNDSGKWSNGVPTIFSVSTIDENMTINQDLTIEGSCIVANAIIDNSGGSAYKAEIKNSGSFIINNDVTFENEVKFLNSSSGSVNGCAVFIVGDLFIENSATLTISACSKLVVNGNLTIKNNIGIVCDGVIEVNGDVYGSNNAVVTGSGSLTATGGVDIVNNATIFGSTTPCSSPPCLFGSPLPIKLLSFDAVLNEEDGIVELKWITLSEINNDYFTIEKSIDAVNYEMVDEVAGSGNSNTLQNYNYTDYNVFNGVSYYRLKQTDFDGKFEYFAPQSVDNNVNANSLIIDNVKPNPFTNRFTVIIESEKAGAVDFIMTNMNGRKVHSSQIELNEGRTEYNCAVGNKIAPGTYIINVIQDGIPTIYKIIKH